MTWITDRPLIRPGNRHTVTLEYVGPGGETADEFEFTVAIVEAGSEGGETGGGTSATEIIRQSQNGETVDVPKGIAFEVHLPSNPSTGYAWSIDFISPQMSRPMERFERSTSGALGAGGTQIYHFDTYGARPPIGTHSIRFANTGPGATEPDEYFEIYVNIVGL
jgi:predicted secreted protein